MPRPAIGKVKAFLNNANGLVDGLVSGWQLGGLLLFQRGPFMTITTTSDPSGTGYNTPLTERLHIQFGAQVANLFNHPNYAPPENLTVGVPAFGQITSLQTEEGAGPRSIQLTGRISSKT
jgi:hypothetical protein